MRKSTRRSMIAATAATVAVLAVLASTRLVAANADDTPTLGPDPVTSLTADLTYGAIGRVPPLTQPQMLLPQFAGFGFAMSDNTWDEIARQEAEEAARKYEEWKRNLLNSIDRLRKEFRDAGIQVTHPDNPLFANQKVEGGSDLVELGGRPSETMPTPDSKFTLGPAGSDSLQAEYTAHARVKGVDTTINGSYQFDMLGRNQSLSSGTVTIDASTLYWPENGGLTLRGAANIVGSDGFTAGVGPTSYSIGITAKSSAGNKVGLSVAVGPDGSPLSLSLGGEVPLPGFPNPVQYRVDLTPSNVNFTADPAPGIEITASGPDGHFLLNLDILKFYPWFEKIVIGK